ncbi:pyridoxal phosphate-dependent aminotransferase [Limobrevibacterium gyesilva]|uniref:Aminotransferase n=1 Tax=Limobrevibacterium gyesilva TaxID=2991712 RepID=A0AA41YTC1_9PROT|nr:pyridoxal phosphate-dependent aminotransferase [Limobrevibacterium gyesilva]MCW3475077.1 pyridoxal phosphate-dependent aminotransferase [Limobrevibacterium gyesilva]
MGLIRHDIEVLEDSPIVDVWRMGYGKSEVIGMFAGEPDVPTPDFICQAASRALSEGKTFYTPNRGIPALREALIAYNKRIYGVDIPDRRIALTPSGMNAVMLVAQGMVKPGDNVVTITPSWPNIMRAMQICGAEVREVAMTSGNDGWSLDLDAVFAACDDKTKVIYTASPGNPTGWMIERGQAEAMLAFARKRNIAILSDEVYHRLVYDRPVAFSFLDIAGPNDPVFVVNSFSKAWAMTGWRLGWVIYPEGCVDAFEKLIQFNTSGAPEFLQHGAIAALRDGEDFVKFFAERCRMGREVVNARLARMPRVRNVPNQGSFYAMFEVDGVTDTLAFCKRAVTEAQIGMAPGIAFGKGAERHIRLCYAKSTELLTEAMDRLEAFVATYQEG